jgi:inhibitor of cysteine peptidase
MTAGAVHEVGEGDDNALFELARGDAIDLRLRENATTGFRWRIKDAGAPVLGLEQDLAAPGPKNRPGAGGSRRLLFRAATEGSTTIELAYARGVPANAEPARTFVLRVRVRP